MMLEGQEAEESCTPCAKRPKCLKRHYQKHQGSAAGGLRVLSDFSPQEIRQGFSL